MKARLPELLLALGLGFPPALAVLWLGGGNWPAALIALLLLGLPALAMSLQRRGLLSDLARIEAALEQMVHNQEPDLPTLAAPWGKLSRHLQAIARYLGIMHQSLQDRQELLADQDQTIKEKDHALREASLAMAHAHAIQQRIGGLLSIDPILTQSTRMVMTYLSANSGFFLKFDLDSDHARVISPINSAFPEHGVVPSTEMRLLLQEQADNFVKLYGLSGERDTKPLISTDTQLLALDASHGSLYGVHFEHALLGPVWIDGELWGVFCCFDKEKRRSGDDESEFAPFGERDRQTLVHVLEFLQKDLKTAYLFEMATIDGLSQLYVRRYFDKRLEEELRRAQRFETPFSVLLLDIDFFKRFNDTYGHLIGDEVIRDVAQVIKEQIRKGVDQAGRYGGEEMAVLLPQTPLANAQVVAERIREAIETHSVTALLTLKDLPHVTASIGVAAFPEHGTTPRELLQRADEGLYKAKESGRNRVCVAGDPLTLT